MKKDPREAEIVRKNIKHFRLELGLSQPQLAFMVGVPPNTVSAWEQEGEQGGGALRSPGVRNLRKLSEVLRRPMDHFFLEQPPTGVIAARELPAFAYKMLQSNPELEREVAEFQRTITKKYRDALAAKRKPRSPG